MRAPWLFLMFLLAACGADEATDNESNASTQAQNVAIVEEFEKVEKTFADGSPEVVGIYTVNEAGFRDKVHEKHFHPNGAISMEGPMLNGKRQGVWKSWYTNGIQWSQNDYENGLRNGKTFSWYENGNLRYEGQYENDKQVGFWQVYDENGTLVSESEHGTSN